MMIRILRNSHGHPFFRTKQKVLGHGTVNDGKVTIDTNVSHQSTSGSLRKSSTNPSSTKGIETIVGASMTLSDAHKTFCRACSLAKIVSRPPYAKANTENIPFLQRIQGDICGPIQPACGPFRYFTVLVDASTRWSHVALLSTRNSAFPKLLAQIIKLMANHPDAPIKTIRIDNAGEFTS